MLTKRLECLKIKTLCKPWLLIVLLALIFLNGQVEKNEILVFVIDTGVSLKAPRLGSYLSNTNFNKDLIDEHGHGTHITSLILFGRNLKDPVCKEVKIVSCRFYYRNSTVTTAECFRRARIAKANFVNFSGGGFDYIPEEHEELKELVKTAKVVVAAGNEASNLKHRPFYPASLNLPDMEVVGNGVSEIDRAPSSNYGLSTIKWVDGQNISSYGSGGGLVVMGGTSQATALRTHELVKEACQKLRSSK